MTIPVIRELLFCLLYRTSSENVPTMPQAVCFTNGLLDLPIIMDKWTKTGDSHKAVQQRCLIIAELPYI